MSTLDDGDFISGHEIGSVLQKFIGINTNKLLEKPSSKDIEILNYYLKYPDRIIRDYYKDRKVNSHCTERLYLGISNNL